MTRRRTLRWALPALAVLALITVGIVALRPSSSNTPPSRALIRYSNGSDRLETTAKPPPGYIAQATLGYLLDQREPGSVSRFQCRYDTDYFSSPDPGCEGKTVVRELGFMYDRQPSGITTYPIYRCWSTNHRDHFSSSDPYCEGKGELYSTLGYVLKQP